MKHEEKQNTCQDRYSRFVNAEILYHQNGESPDTALENINVSVLSIKDESESIRDDITCSFNEGETKSLNSSEQEYEMKMGNKLEESNTYTRHIVASKDEILDQEYEDFTRSNSLSTSYGNSGRTFTHGCDSRNSITKEGYDFSRQNMSNTYEEEILKRQHEYYTRSNSLSSSHGKSRRTFRHGSQSRSSSSKTKGEDFSAQMLNTCGEKILHREHEYNTESYILNSSFEKSGRTFRYGCGSSSGSSKTKEGEYVSIQNMPNTGYNQKHISLDSESFHSVQSWIESKKEGSSHPLSTKLKYLNNNRSELLKLVEELKNQLGTGDKRLPQYLLQCNKSRRHSKRFFRPVLGGAPFVICYHCFEILQIPVDFLISTRRLNKLKCSVCSEILLLQFPAIRNGNLQGSSESGNSSEDPISFSEKYGVSTSESCSAIENVSALNVSRASSYKDGNSNCSLHQLMGYSSARVLLQ